MAEIFEFTEQERRQWDEWVNERPMIVQGLAQRFPPNRLYKLRPTGQIVTLASYVENGTLTVNVDHYYNDSVILDRQVFGIKPEDLEETELPVSDNDASSGEAKNVLN